jgi:DNA-directed RNA polymerase specialized sigma24 family protein
VDFEELFRSERDALVRMCWLLTLDREAATDIAQEAMARAW